MTQIRWGGAINNQYTNDISMGSALIFNQQDQINNVAAITMQS